MSLPRPPVWIWILPRAALFLSLLAVAALLWLLHRNDLEEQRATLISDVLWIEQDMRFQLDRNTEQLQQLGLERSLGAIDGRGFETRAKNLLANSQGLVQLIYLDADGRELTALPPQLSERLVGEAVGKVPSPETTHFARQIGKAAYSPPYPVVQNDTQFEVHVPLFSDQRFIGMVVGIYSLRELLAKQVPWWFGQKYRLVVTDDGGTVLASKSNVEAGSTTVNYQLPFDPPGHGLLLQVIVHRSETRLLPALLFTTIIGLSLAIVWSLWVLRRHVQHRYDAENALREEHAFRKAMEDSLLIGVRARDLEGRTIYVNRSFCRMVGWSAEELVGRKPPMPYWAPEELEATRAAHGRVLAGNAPPEGFEVRLQRRNGERFDALIYEAPLIDAQGRHTGWMGSVLDITERKRTEEWTRQQQERLQATARLVTMGELASALAHELNQPLSAIASYNTGCLNKLERGEINRDELTMVARKIAQQAQRAGQIIRRIYDFVRRSAPKRESCDVNAVIEDSIGLAEAEARKHGIRIVPSLADGLPPVAADRVMIEQAVVNLIRNGMDAMREVPPDTRELRIATSSDGESVHIRVADRGTGIAPEVAGKLFAPFFTTKAEGMGMGLNICRSIAEVHKGRLWFDANNDNQNQHGTVFHLTLPLTT